MIAELPDAVYQAVCDSFWQAENQPLRVAFAAAYAAGIQAGRVNVTEYTFNEHPDENMIDHDLYRVTVAYRGHGQWGVYQRSWCVDADGRLCREPIPGDRDPQWLAGHRFDLETALRLAQELAPKVTVNGLTAAGQAEWEANLKARTP